MKALVNLLVCMKAACCYCQYSSNNWIFIFLWLTYRTYTPHKKGIIIHGFNLNKSLISVSLFINDRRYFAENAVRGQNWRSLFLWLLTGTVADPITEDITWKILKLNSRNIRHWLSVFGRTEVFNTSDVLERLPGRNSSRVITRAVVEIRVFIYSLKNDIQKALKTNKI